MPAKCLRRSVAKAADRRSWPGLALLVAAGLVLSGCQDGDIGLFGTDEEEPPLPGERISVLVLERALEPDPELVAEPVRLPRPTINPIWPQQGGYPNHAMHHLAGGESLQEVWSRGVGAGETDDNLILSTPVVTTDRLFILDAESVVTAVDLATGSVDWEVDLIPEDEDDDASLGGGVAYAGGRVFASTAFGTVAALDERTGQMIWRTNLGGPIRAAPTVAGGRVFAITYDNTLHTIDGVDGTVLWTHSGISESAGLLGSAVPAVSGDLVVVPYSSGELFALRVENGRVAWGDSLIFQGRLGTRTSLSDIDGSPVIDRGVVFAVSHSGRLVAIDLRSGVRLWDQEISSAQTPWVAGDYLFVVTTDMDLVCLRRVDGRVRWVRTLPRFEDPEDRLGPIVWSGPVLIGDRLVVVSDKGEALAVSPYTGRLLGSQELPDGVRVPAIIANGTLYILTVDADVVALR